MTGIDTRKKFIDKELDRESTTYNTGVRQYDPEGPGFASVDPLWEEFRAWTPYHYAHDNPVGLKDPSGLQVGEKNDNGGGGAISPAGGSVAPEGYWSVRPVFRGLSRFWRNLTGSGSGGSSATTATGGASSGGGVSRGTVSGRGATIRKNAINGRNFESKTLRDMGLEKNTRKIEGTTTKGKAIPDAMTSTRIVEIKDVLRLSNTKQFRIGIENAIEAKKSFELVVSGRNAYISQPLREEIFKTGGGIYQNDNGVIKPLSF